MKQLGMSEYFVVGAVAASVVFLVGAWLLRRGSRSQVRVAGVCLCAGAVGLVTGYGIALARCPRLQCEHGHGSLPDLLIVAGALSLAAAIVLLVAAASQRLRRRASSKTMRT
jgi:drug/metabolite transporter (DMT)-like permease